MVLYSINEMVAKSMEIADGIVIYYPEIGTSLPINVLANVAGRDRTYASRRGATAFVIGGRLYVTPMRDAVVALEAIGFSRSGLQVPFAPPNYALDPKIAAEWWRLCQEAEAKKK